MRTERKKGQEWARLPRATLPLAMLLSVVACAASPAPPRAEAPAHTPSARPAAQAQRLHFIVYGDCRTGHEIHRQIVAMIMQRKPELVLQTGDLVESGSNGRLWRIYDSITGEMRKKIPVYPALGNHDLGGTGYEERVPAAFTSGNWRYYSFDRAGCHFVSVDVFAPFGPGTAQYEWLEKDLANAHHAARSIFVFYHEPAYSIGPHGSNMDVRKALCPLFDKYGVRIVFQGHDHIYYRTIRSGIPYVVTGGGGAPLYPCHADEAIKGDVFESVNHLIDCYVDGGRVRCTAIRTDGSTLDVFTTPPGS